MNILLTTHQLADFAGSEVYTYELAKGLVQAGNTVTVYSRYIDKFELLFAREGIKLVTDLTSIAHEQFDIAHVHHHINALEVRKTFPTLPIFFLSHGAKSFLENPPEIEINITKYGAISHLVKKNLQKHGIPGNKIVLVKNIVNQGMFAPTAPIHDKPQRALIISNRIDRDTECTIKKACRSLGIEVTCIGQRFKRVRNDRLPVYINKADIVFTIGRGVIETMMCGRMPFVLDYMGGDGFVTPSSYQTHAKVNFNGTFTATKYTTKQLVRQLKQYRSTDGAALRTIALSNHSSTACVPHLMETYESVIREYKQKRINQELLQYIVDTIHTTRSYNFSRSEHRGIRQFLYDVNAMLFSPLYRRSSLTSASR